MMYETLPGNAEDGMTLSASTFHFRKTGAAKNSDYVSSAI